MARLVLNSTFGKSGRHLPTRAFLRRINQTHAYKFKTADTNAFEGHMHRLPIFTPAKA